MKTNIPNWEDSKFVGGYVNTIPIKDGVYARKGILFGSQIYIIFEFVEGETLNYKNIGKLKSLFNQYEI